MFGVRGCKAWNRVRAGLGLGPGLSLALGLWEHAWFETVET